MEPWLIKGGYDMRLVVPPIPRGALVERIRAKEAENNHGWRVRFKIVGRRGVTLEERMKTSNSWAGEGFGRDECFQCKAVIVGEKVFAPPHLLGDPD